MADGGLDITAWLRAIWGPENDLDVQERAVLTCILRRANSTDGTCFPGFGRLATDSKVSRRKVIRAIQRLDQLGWITKHQTKRGDGFDVNHYTIRLEPPTSAPETLPNTRGSARETPLTADTSAPETPEVVHESTSGSAQEHHELTHITNPSTNPERGSPKKSRSKGWRRVPDEWTPTPDHVTLAADLGVDIEAARAKFIDHEFAKPKRDADACFRIWLRNEAVYQRNRGPTVPTRPRPRSYGKGPVQPNYGHMSTPDFLARHGVMNLGADIPSDVIDLAERFSLALKWHPPRLTAHCKSTARMVELLATYSAEELAQAVRAAPNDEWLTEGTKGLTALTVDVVGQLLNGERKAEGERKAILSP